MYSMRSPRVHSVSLSPIRLGTGRGAVSALYTQSGPNENNLDEPKGFIHVPGRFVYHTTLYNQLLGHSTRYAKSEQFIQRCIEDICIFYGQRHPLHARRR